jgi:hypothetical protein
MKTKNLYLMVLILVGVFFFGGCYTQLKLEDDDYSYNKTRKRVIIEKRIEKDGDEVTEQVDTTYESTDNRAYEEETYYYPRHRRAYKFYHPGITIVVGGAVYYDPWYFNYFYYPYTVCRTYYLPWWYGYYSCYRVWYGFAYYDPFYNPFYAPPYWWYDPYWYGGYYPPIVQYRKNDYTRLRNQDGGRRGSIITGNWGRDLNLQVASERTRLRNIDGSTLRNSSERERRRTTDINNQIPTLRSGYRNIERDKTPPASLPQRKPSDKNVDRNRQDDRKPNSTGRERIQERTPNRNPDRSTPNREGNDSPSRRRFESNVPKLEREIIIERKVDDKTTRSNDNSNPTNSNPNLRNYRNERIRIEYDIPRREYTPRFESESNRRFEQETKRNYDYNTPQRNSQRTRNDVPVYQSPRYEPPRYEPPRYESPERSNTPSNTPRSVTPPPTRTPSPNNDRGRER